MPAVLPISESLLSIDDIKECNSYLSQAYQEDSNQEIEYCPYKVTRPNHGLAHSIRMCSYIHFVIPFFAAFAKDEDLKQFCIQLMSNPQAMKKLAITLLFTDSGRQSESIADIPRFKIASALNLQKYLIKTFPLITKSEIEQYSEICKYIGNKENFNLSQIQEIKFAQIVLNMASDLDLQRCCNANAYQKAMSFYDQFLISNENNNHSILELCRLATVLNYEVGNKLHCQVTDSGWLSSGRLNYSKKKFVEHSQSEQAYVDYKSFIQYQLPVLIDESYDNKLQFLNYNEPFFYKAIRADERNFWSSFIASFVYGEHQHLRKIHRAGIFSSRLARPDANGICRYETLQIADRQPLYSAKEKTGYTKHQSVSYADPKRDYLPAAFGMSSGRELTGIILAPKDVLIQRIMLYDSATHDRYYDSDEYNIAKAYIDDKLEKGIYQNSLDGLVLKGNLNQEQHNEVMARLRANPDTSLQVAIFNSESYLCRIQAQLRALDLQICLQDKLGHDVAPIPIRFYSRFSWGLTYYYERDRNIDRINLLNKKFPSNTLYQYQLFFRYFPDNFKSMSRHEWNFLMPLLFNMGKATQRLAHAELFKQAQNDYALCGLIISKISDYLDNEKNQHCRITKVIDEQFYINLLQLLEKPIYIDKLSKFIDKILQQAAQFQPSLMMPLLQWLEQRFSNEEFRTIILRTGSDANLLSITLRYQPEITELVFKTIIKLAKDDKLWLRNIFDASNNMNKELFVMAVFNKVEAVEPLLKVLQYVADGDVIWLKMTLEQCNRLNHNALTLAAKYHPQFLNPLLDMLTNVVGNDREWFSKLIFHQNDAGETVLTLVMHYGRQDVIELFLHKLTVIFQGADGWLNSMLLYENKQHMNFLHLAILYQPQIVIKLLGQLGSDLIILETLMWVIENNPSKLSFFLEILNTISDTSKLWLKKILTMQNSAGFSPLMLAVSCSKLDVVKQLSTFILAVGKNDNVWLKKLFAQKSNYSNNILYLAVINKSTALKHILDSISLIAADDASWIKKLFSVVNIDNNNLLLLLCDSEQLEPQKYLIQIIKQLAVGDSNWLLELLKQVNKDDETVLLKARQVSAWHFKSVLELIDLVQEKDFDKLIKMIAKVEFSENSITSRFNYVEGNFKLLLKLLIRVAAQDSSWFLMILACKNGDTQTFFSWSKDYFPNQTAEFFLQLLHFENKKLTLSLLNIGNDYVESFANALVSESKLQLKVLDLDLVEKYSLYPEFLQAVLKYVSNHKWDKIYEFKQKLIEFIKVVKIVKQYKVEKTSFEAAKNILAQEYLAKANCFSRRLIASLSKSAKNDEISYIHSILQEIKRPNSAITTVSNLLKNISENIYPNPGTNLYNCIVAICVLENMEQTYKFAFDGSSTSSRITFSTFFNNKSFESSLNSLASIGLPT